MPGIFGVRVRRTGPSSEGRPRSVLWPCYLRVAFIFGAGFSFVLVASAFLRAFSFSDLATALRLKYV